MVTFIRTSVVHDRDNDIKVISSHWPIFFIEIILNNIINKQLYFNTPLTSLLSTFNVQAYRKILEDRPEATILPHDKALISYSIDVWTRSKGRLFSSISYYLLLSDVSAISITIPLRVYPNIGSSPSHSFHLRDVMPLYKMIYRMGYVRQQYSA